MNEGRVSHWQLLMIPPLVFLALLPVVVRAWPEIVQMAPVWLLMLGQALALIAVIILLAAIAALATAWVRKRRDSDA